MQGYAELSEKYMDPSTGMCGTLCRGVWNSVQRCIELRDVLCRAVWGWVQGSFGPGVGITCFCSHVAEISDQAETLRGIEAGAGGKGRVGAGLGAEGRFCLEPGLLPCPLQCGQPLLT